MRLHPSDPIPSMLGAHDDLCMQRQTRRWQDEGAANHEAPTAARKQHLLRCMTASLNAGDAGALATFARPNPTTKKLYTLAQVVQEGVECADLHEAVIQVLLNAARGQDVQAAAQFVLTAAAAKFCACEAEEL